MKDVLILELAQRWEREAIGPEIETEGGSEDERIENAIGWSRRKTKEECAQALRMLISILGE